MTYGIPRPTSVKGNVTINSAMRGLNKRGNLCATCIESSNFETANCYSCEKGRIPKPLLTLNGFDDGINGTYSLRWSSDCVFVNSSPQNQTTIDATWPLWWSPGTSITAPIPTYDSTIFNGFNGLSCRKFDYEWNSEERVCYECGFGQGKQFAIPQDLPATLNVTLTYRSRPYEIIMGNRIVGRQSNGLPLYAGGTWDVSRKINVVPPRTFTVPAGVTVTISKRMSYDEKWRKAAVGDVPNSYAIYHASLPKSATARDRWGNPLLRCFNTNVALRLVAKSIESDSLNVGLGSVNPDRCQGAPAQTPPYLAQTPTHYNLINDFGTTGTVRLSTSEAIVELLMGSDLAAVAETDASCTVTDG